jgi:mRNA interferase MazF
VTSPVAPWQVWWADLNPVRGHEQAGVRPILVVSSTFHLRLTRSGVLTVLPLTTRARPHLLHRVTIDIPGQRTSYVITEQLRSISADRLTGRQPMHQLTMDQIVEVRDVLRRMIDV